LRLYPLDVDHDGDLDIFGARAGQDIYLQNNGSNWTERAEELGLAGEQVASSDLVSADLDSDGDLDLVVVHPGSGPRLYLNRRAGMFVDSSHQLNLDPAQSEYVAARAADFDNDGLFDLLLWGPKGGVLLTNRQQHYQPVAPSGLADRAWQAAEVLDADNDGDQDVLAVVGEELLLLRNRGQGELIAEPTGQELPQARQLLSDDYDTDGDLDLLALQQDGQAKFLRNDGGNQNNWIGLQLKGKNDNNGKNNTQGLFVRIEMRAGEEFQLVQGNGGRNHLGLGARRQADVIRAVWTNGVPQVWQLVGANRMLVEEQVLKGSCPFLYLWDGQEFTFVTDLMWRSPLGMILPDGSPAPHQSARDFVKINGEALRPAGGELWMQTTEELWEVVYVDEQGLIAVDYPAELELLVDEKFSPPPHASEPPIHWVDRLLVPIAARDHLGRDVLKKIEHRDGIHVDGLPLDRFQGLTAGHELRLTFSDVPGDERLRLVLSGWIFPTDTSINLALSQDSQKTSRPPRLEVLQPDGSWRVLEVWVGFPNGKSKVVVVELPDDLPPGDLTVRIPTNMQIYWDSARLAVGDPIVSPVMTALRPKAAELHFRGFSRMYRRTATGPHLFDYKDVSVGPRFRDMVGPFTRYGPVEELLRAADDRYVVMNAGDEMTVRFDASLLPPLPTGWKRDFILHTDGWVKDGDLNTVFSQTVLPLPYHAMSSYPDRPIHRYPDSPEHRSYLETYQTRWVTDQGFRELLTGANRSSDGD
jgi:hypothetical protein